MMDALTSRKAMPEEGTRAAFRFLCQTDLYALCTRVLYRDRQPQHLDPEFHRPICEAMQTSPYDENLWLYQRGSFKTAVLNAGRNFQRILQHPEIRILIASNKGDNAEEMLKELTAFCTDPMMVWAFPDIFESDPTKLPEWTKARITVKSKRRGRGSTVDTIGVTGELTSKHYDHATYDDVVGKENYGSKEARAMVIDFYKQSRALIDPVTSWGAPSSKDLIGTTWHHADLYSFLILQARVHGMRLGIHRLPCWMPCASGDPLGADVPGHGWVRPTFTKRWTMAKLLQERRDIGSSEFSAQYLLDPIGSETAHFKRDKIVLRDTCPPLEDLWIAMTVDPAISLQSHADYSGIAVGGFDRRGDLILLDLIQEKRDDAGLVRLIYDTVARWPLIKYIGIESVGFAAAYRSLLAVEGDRRGRHLPIVALARDTTKRKNQRIAGLQGYWEAGQISALRSCRDLEDFLDQADKFRTDRENDHDDLLDAVVDLYQLRLRPSPSSAPSPEADPELAARRAFEARLLAQRPDLDAMSLRVAWQREQMMQEVGAAQESVALGILDPEVMAIGH